MLELGCNGKAQQNVKRDMAVVPALARQGLCKEPGEHVFLHRKEDVVNQVGEMTFLLHLFFLCVSPHKPFPYLFGISVS